MIIFLYCLTALFLSHSLAQPQSTGKLHSLGPWPRNMWGISRPNNGCLCFLHLLLPTDIHLYPFLPFYLELSFPCFNFPTLVLPLFNSPTSSAAKHRGIKLSDILTLSALADINDCGWLDVMPLPRLLPCCSRGYTWGISQTYSC